MTWGWGWLESLVQDVRFAMRQLLKTPGFTITAILTLALGIGANAAIFSVLQGVLLKPLPYPQSDRLVAVDHVAPGVNLKNTGMAPFLYFTYREGSRTLDDIGMWQGDSLSVTGLAEPAPRAGVAAISTKAAASSAIRDRRRGFMTQSLCGWPLDQHRRQRRRRAENVLGALADRLWAELQATRKPMLLFRLSGEFLFR